MNCLLTLLRKTYNRIIPDNFDNTLESKVYRITKDFKTKTQHVPPWWVCYLN